MTYGKKAVTVEKVENGYILEWSEPAETSTSWSSTFPKPTTGREIHTTKKSVMDRLKSFL